MSEAEFVPRPATYDDILALPEHVVGEIVDGELVVSPRPASPHARASSRLGSILGPAFDEGIGGPGGWIILDEPELHLRRDVLVPDLAGWRRERMPVLPTVPSFELAPDWICEVLTPSTSRLDRTRKRRIYARERIEWCWLVDPAAQVIEVFRLQGELWTLVQVDAGREVVRLEPFSAVEFDLGRLWGDSPPTGVAEERVAYAAP